MTCISSLIFGDNLTIGNRRTIVKIEITERALSVSLVLKNKATRAMEKTCQLI